MKMIVAVALALVAVAFALPVQEEPAKTLRAEFETKPNGNYDFGFETSNGIQRQENGEVKEVLDEEKKPHNVVVVRGSYAYPGEDGAPVVVTYYADEFGYKAEGDSIPKVQARR